MIDISTMMMRLISCAITGSDIVSVSFTCEEVEKLLALSKHHDVAHLVSYAIAVNKLVLPDCDASKKIKKRHPIAVVRYEALNRSYNQICEALENGKVPFIPLKGSVIRELYPEPWMRTSCDVDVLVHENDVETASKILVESLGYEKKDSGTHEVSFFSPSGTHVELHFTLSEVFYESNAEKLLNDVWEYAIVKDESEFHHVLKDEFYYLYHVYHMAKHFESGGCGIRPFIDMYLLDTAMQYDKDRREELLGASGLSVFASKCRELYKYWFCEGEADELTKRFQSYILFGGVYGNKENRRGLKNAKTDNKLGYLIGRVFLSYDKLKIQFPVIRKYKFLTPLFEVVRWFKILNPKYRKVAKNELEFTMTKKTSESTETWEFLHKLGLK